MSELISGKEAAQAFINGEQVEFLDKTGQWRTIFDNTVLRVFRDHDDFRLKPRTVNLNGVEVPAPFEPKIGEKYWIIETSDKNSYSYISSFENDEQDESLTKLGAWRTESDIKQVVAALRYIFKPQ